MIVLHAMWNNLSGQLYVWAESSIYPTLKTHSKNIHPFALPSRLLEEKIHNISPCSSLEKANFGTLTVSLPSTSRNPLPSPELIVTDREDEKTAEIIPWDIPAVIFDPYAAFDFLLSLPDHPPSKVSFGSSLRFWMEVAKFSLELLTKQCFIPSLKEIDGTFHAFWEGFITEDDERIRVLSQVMPPVCRAFSSDNILPANIIQHFLNCTVDAFVRKTFFFKAVLPPRRGRPPKTIPLPETWLKALSSKNPVIKGSDKELNTFSYKVHTWINQIKSDSSPFRLCFKLDPPDNDNQWVLGFYLQAKDDKSLLIPAQKIWRVQSDVTTFLQRKFENPQERLLTDLGKASQLYPQIESSLKTTHPVMKTLTTEQAYTFLRHSAPLLTRSGIGVLLPPWWQSAAARLGVKLTVKQPPRTGGQGLLGIDGILAYEWRIAVGDETLSLEEFRKLASLKVPLVKIRGQWVELRPSEVEKAIAFFEKNKGTGEMFLSDALRLRLGEEHSDVGLPVIDIEGEGRIGQFLDTLLTSRIKMVEPPESFCGTLRPYQVTGLSWLAFLTQFGLGACLADDMGLGKTIQIIALLLHERTTATPGPTLVVCPMSVVGNWYKEVERFAPSLKVMVHHGQNRLSESFAKEAQNHDMIITTYALAHRDENHLSAVKWERIVLDEAQNIKNPWAKRTQAIKRLKARHKTALTGTPVENRLSELWSIMDFLNKGYLRSQKEFHKKFAIPIERYHSISRAKTLKTLIKPFLLRRLKTDKEIIKDLPEKMEMKVFCNLTEEQATLYEAVVQEMLDKIEDSEGIKRKGLVLSTLMKLKQVCNHPAQFLHDNSELEARSGKLTRLKEMLEEVLAEGDKALLFTQFREMGSMLQKYVQEQLTCKTLFLHGGTPKKKRDTMVERFQQKRGPPLFVLSLKAGGLGLNLTAATHVFHFDRWWNPAVENQATDRAFRIGQTKNVQVHKFVCLGTLEERIDTMIEQKKELADKVVGTGEGWITKMSTQELRELLALNKEWEVHR